MSGVAVLVTVGVVGFGIGLCLAYKSDRERPWLLTLLPVAVGLVVLALPELDGIAFVLAGHLVALSRAAADKAAPFLLLLALVGMLFWRGRHWWRVYHALSPLGRGRVLLCSVLLGVAIAAVLRVVPGLPDAARVAGEGARAGWDAGIDRAIQEADERLNGGDAAP